MRQEGTRALYERSLADVGEPNPYAGRSLVLAKLWMRGYRRMLSVGVSRGPAMQRYLAARRAGTLVAMTTSRRARRRWVSDLADILCDRIALHAMNFLGVVHG